MSSTLTLDSGASSTLPNSDTYSFHVGQGSNVFPQPVPLNHPSTNTWFSGGLPTPPPKREMTGTSLGHNYGRQASQASHVKGSQDPAPATDHRYSSHHRASSDLFLFHETRTNSNGTRFESAPQQELEKANQEQIAAHLQLPQSVNSSRGSLAEFSTDVTCLFWFESSAALKYAESLAVADPCDRGLGPDTTPSIGFKKWVTTILSTTQVGKNVVLLALLFIYRLKKFNPAVSGKRGSEYRLLTIALMLGNKFLDDNTYTNKTWAEVSGIPVQEIHIMEVEFLSNMRYELYVSEAQWAEWKVKLGRFHSFFSKATHFETKSLSGNLTPMSQIVPHKLPSPPSGTRHVANVHYSTLPNPTMMVPQLPRSPSRQYIPTDTHLDRKRSLDVTSDMPPAKRIHHAAALSLNYPTPAPLLTPSYAADANGPTATSVPVEAATSNRVPHLPMPRVSLTVNGPAMHLPPLSLPNGRAMANVYPATPASYPHSTTPVAAIGPTMPQMYPLGFPHTDVGRTPSSHGSANTSPVNFYGTTTPTRPGLSPSYFLTNRSSPYRPVRHVNTLLIPPPSAAMQNPVRDVSYDQMHYQPLSKTSTERRTGPVPYYRPDAWHSQANTPLSQQYRLY